MIQEVFYIKVYIDIHSCLCSISFFYFPFSFQKNRWNKIILRTQLHVKNSQKNRQKKRSGRDWFQVQNDFPHLKIVHYSIMLLIHRSKGKWREFQMKRLKRLCK